MRPWVQSVAMGVAEKTVDKAVKIVFHGVEISRGNIQQQAVNLAVIIGQPA